MSTWLFNVYIDAVMKEVKMGMGRRGVRIQDEIREWRLPGFLYAEDLVLCGESEEELRAIVGRFIEVITRSGLKINVSKSKVKFLVGKVVSGRKVTGTIRSLVNPRGLQLE